MGAESEGKEEEGEKATLKNRLSSPFESSVDKAYH